MKLAVQTFNSLFIIVVLFFSSCNQTNNKQINQSNMTTQVKSGISKASFGKTNDGTEVYLWTLTNKNGMTAKITNYEELSLL